MSTERTETTMFRTRRVVSFDHGVADICYSWRWKWWAKWTVAAIVVAAFVALVVGIGAAITAYEGARCEARADAREVDGWLGGWNDWTCYVRTDEGRILTVEQYDVRRHEIEITGDRP